MTNDRNWNVDVEERNRKTRRLRLVGVCNSPAELNGDEQECGRDALEPFVSLINQEHKKELVL